MGKTNWTDNQKKAIETPASVLVNAAAGSGKTAVLVERIIRKITDDKCDIDRLLIVTFARDAAAQMQQRIKNALNEKIKEAATHEEAAEMRRQIRLLGKSDITTIDAFCINVVKANFHALGIDPGFNIIDANEAKIMLEAALDEFLDKMYEERDERIKIITENYSMGFGDYALKQMIIGIFTFTRSLPEPKKWIRECANMYLNEGEGKWTSYNEKKILRQKEETEKKAEKAFAEIAKYTFGEEISFKDITSEEKQQMIEYNEKTAEAVVNLSEYLSGNENVTMTKLSKVGIKGDNKEDVKYLVDVYNEFFEIFSKYTVAKNMADGAKKMYSEGIYPPFKVLTEVICEFDDYFFESKKKKNNFEFNDLEHLAYELLRDFDDIRENYGKKYDEILMDEYQDTNALQEGIFELISPKRFMVGDMKQSIYRFRNSDPFIFKSKDKLYAENSNEGTRIMLSENFRSRPQVLNSINQIFSRIMTEEAGEIDYDENQALKWGNPVYSNREDERYFSKLCILEGKEAGADEDEDNVKIEARYVASEIRRMIDEKFPVFVSKDETRPAKAGDFVILLNAVKTVGGVYTDELKKVGISSYAESTGYFDNIEIMLITSLLEVISNPTQDIYVTAVLRSVLFGFSDDDLAQIRIGARGKCMFDAALKAGNGEGVLAEKSRLFCEKVEKWREYARYMTSDKLIWTLYEETSFYDLMGIMYGGEQAQANLRLFFEKARQYEKTGFKGLHLFLQYVDRMKKSEQIGGAALLSDNREVVRIMTIHKSKGLEFPVCFLSGVGKHFSSSVSGGVRMHKDWGIAVDCVDTERGIFMHTPLRDTIDEVRKKEEQAENLRKLYVGMTRAKEKLIVTGVVSGNKYDESGNRKSGGYLGEKEKWNTVYSPEKNKMEAETVNKATRFIDWIAPIVLAHKSEIGWQSDVIPYNLSVTAEESGTEDIKSDTSDISDEHIEALLGFEYETTAKGIPGKISVTGIKKLKAEFETEEDAADREIEKKHMELSENAKTRLNRPSFMMNGGLTGAERGIAYHTVMSEIKINKDMTEEYIKEELQRILDEGLLTHEEIQVIDTKKIAEFFKSNVGEKIKKADKIWREEPFEIYVKAGEVLENENLLDDEMLLQGVIDCMIECGGELLIIDYKTDRGSTDEELKSHYENQLLWYKKAAEILTEKNVSEGILYSFESGKEIKVF